MSSSLIVFLIIVISYYYCSGHPALKIKLKQSQGWETFVLLGKYGALAMLEGLFIALLIFMLIVGVLFVFTIPYYLELVSEWPNLLGVLHPSQYDLGTAELACVILVSFSALIWARNDIKKYIDKPSEEQLRLLSHLADDARIKLLIDAIERIQPVKISLKSGKVYIGLVMAEVFEPSDFDHIVIIPIYSGYRKQDNLTVTITTFYKEVYDMHGIDKLLSSQGGVGLDHFRYVIVCSEIESISLFDVEYFADFGMNQLNEDSA